MNVGWAPDQPLLDENGFVDTNRFTKYHCMIQLGNDDTGSPTRFPNSHYGADRIWSAASDRDGAITAER